MSQNQSGGGCSNPNSDQITLYVRTGFDSGGQCITKGIGEYPNPGSIGLPNDSIRSIKVGSNVRARLCQDDGFREPCQWFESDNGDLNGTSVGYGTSSVKVESKPPAPGCSNPNADQITLYVRTGFDANGQCITKGIGEYRQPGDIGLPNDSIQSIKVGSNVRARLCQHADFGEPCEWFQSDNGDLRNSSVGSGTSSVKVEERPRELGVPTPLNPADGTVFGRTDSISLSWSSAANAYDYFAELWGGPSGTLSSGWTQGQSWYLGQLGGGTYYWHVKSGNGAGGASDWSGTRNFTVKYGHPTNLSASAVSSSEIELSWSASADAPDNIDGYRIYRGGTAIATVGSSTTTYQNTGLACENTYSYVVKAYKGSAESDASNSAEATPGSCVPSVPADFRVTGTTRDTVSLACSDTNNESGYKLYRWDVRDEQWDFYFYGTLSANVTEFTDTDLNCDAHYFYEISAYNGSGESAHTGWIEGVTTACLSDIPTLAAPADGAVLNQADSITLSWNTAEHAYDYIA